MIQTTITLKTPIFLNSGKVVYSLVVVSENKFCVNGDSPEPILADIEGEEINVFQHNIAGLAYANVNKANDTESGETIKNWRDKMPDVLSIIKDKDEATSKSTGTKTARGRY